VTPAPVIDQQTVYTLHSLTDLLGLKKGTLPREMRLGRLRYAKRAGRVYVLGEWVLAWLRAGEVLPPRNYEPVGEQFVRP
jgi:hypothetical protein